MNAAEIIKHARTLMTDLTGLPIDTVSGVKYSEGQWHVTLDLIEMRTVPNNRDVLAVYALVLDDAGNLLSYERTHRYYRGQVAK